MIGNVLSSDCLQARTQKLASCNSAAYCDRFDRNAADYASLIRYELHPEQHRQRQRPRFLRRLPHRRTIARGGQDLVEFQSPAADAKPATARSQIQTAE